MVDHTVKSYDRELDTLERRVAEMGGIGEKMVIDCMDALTSADTVLAHQVVATDMRLDALQREIEALVVSTIARRQPVAIDLRGSSPAMGLVGRDSAHITIGSIVSDLLARRRCAAAAPNP